MNDGTTTAASGRVVWTGGQEHLDRLAAIDPLLLKRLQEVVDFLAERLKMSLKVSAFDFASKARNSSKGIRNGILRDEDYFDAAVQFGNSHGCAIFFRITLPEGETAEAARIDIDEAIRGVNNLMDGHFDMPQGSADSQPARKGFAVPVDEDARVSAALNAPTAEILDGLKIRLTVPRRQEPHTLNEKKGNTMTLPLALQKPLEGLTKNAFAVTLAAHMLEESGAKTLSKHKLSKALASADKSRFPSEDNALGTIQGCVYAHHYLAAAERGSISLTEDGEKIAAEVIRGGTGDRRGGGQDEKKSERPVASKRKVRRGRKAAAPDVKPKAAKKLEKPKKHRLLIAVQKEISAVGVSLAQKKKRLKEIKIARAKFDAEEKSLHSEISMARKRLSILVAELSTALGI